MADKKTKTARLTEAEYEAIQTMRQTSAMPVTQTAEPPPPPNVGVGAVDQLATALQRAIESTRPPEKKTVDTRKARTPWSPPEGVARAKFKRPVYQHGIALQISDNDPSLTNQEIELLNQVRPGIYCDGHVKVNKTRDRGVNIDYPVKTAAQRLKLVNQFGIRSLSELCERLIDEHARPAHYKRDDDPEF